MDFYQQYPDLANFISSEFPDADLEGFVSDEDVVKCYVLRVSHDVRVRIIEQGKSLLEQIVFFPWETIRQAANRYFSSEAEARQWLTMIIQCLESLGLQKEIFEKKKK
jgi:hypothetical protein